jgi:hypothetical protein
LMIEYESLDYRDEVANESIVEPLERFTRRKIECS